MNCNDQTIESIGERLEYAAKSAALPTSLHGPGPDRAFFVAMLILIIVWLALCCRPSRREWKKRDGENEPDNIIACSAGFTPIEL